MKSLLRPLFCLVISLLTAGCVTTSVTGYTDRDFEGYTVSRVVIRAPNSGFAFGKLLEDSIARRLSNYDVKTETFLDRFPPTREWTNAEVAEELMADGYDTIMYINLIGSETSSQTVGFINHGSGYAYGNMASYNSTSSAMSVMSRFTSTRITLYDVKTAKVIWVGDSNTAGRGLAFVGDRTQTDSMASELVSTLISSGHVRRRP